VVLAVTAQDGHLRYGGYYEVEITGAVDFVGAVGANIQAAQKAADEKRQAEAQKAADEKRQAEAQKAADEKRQAEAQKAADEKRQAEAARAVAGRPTPSTPLAPMHVSRDPDGSFVPASGYDWVDPSTGRDDLRVKWTPGSRYGPQWPHVVASDAEGKWKAESGYEFVNTPLNSDYSVRPIPQPAPPTSLYNEGSADRTAWEKWYGGLSSGDFQNGANWWSTERNTQRLPCEGPESKGSEQFIQGCNAAKAFFKREYQYRQLPKDNPDRVDYINGWNAMTAAASSPTPSAAPPNAQGSANQLNLKELERLRSRQRDGIKKITVASPDVSKMLRSPPP
jgi:hypothetical protein